MKRVVQTVETEGDGLESLLDENVILLCVNYFYAGKLVGVNDKDVILENPHIIYETGEWTASTFKVMKKLPVDEWRVRTEAIESYGLAPQLK